MRPISFISLHVVHDKLECAAGTPEPVKRAKQVLAPGDRREPGVSRAFCVSCGAAKLASDTSRYKHHIADAIILHAHFRAKVMPDKAFEKYDCRVHRQVCPVDDVLCLCLQRHLVTGCLSGMIPSGSFAPGAQKGAPGYCLEMPCQAF